MFKFAYLIEKFVCYLKFDRKRERREICSDKIKYSNACLVFFYFNPGYFNIYFSHFSIILINYTV